MCRPWSLTEDVLVFTRPHPTSQARTSIAARSDWLVSSGFVRHLLCRASAHAAPSALTRASEAVSNRTYAPWMRCRDVLCCSRRQRFSVEKCPFSLTIENSHGSHDFSPRRVTVSPGDPFASLEMFLLHTRNITNHPSFCSAHRAPHLDPPKRTNPRRRSPVRWSSAFGSGSRTRMCVVSAIRVAVLSSTTPSKVQSGRHPQCGRAARAPAREDGEGKEGVAKGGRQLKCTPSEQHVMLLSL